MRMHLFLGGIAPALIALASSGCASRGTDDKRSSTSFDAVVDDYLDALHRRRPASAAATGIHVYDDRLEDYSERAIADEVAEIRRFAERLAAVDPATLEASDAIDWRLLCANAKARLLELEVIQSWRRNPQIYSDAISSGHLWLALFPSESASKRLDHVVSKLEQAPRLLESARANVVNPSKELIDAGVDAMNGTVSFLEDDLPQAFSGAGDPAAQEKFDIARRAALDALSATVSHFQGLRKNASGSFALGRDAFESKLRLEEGIDASTDALMAVAERELREAQRRFLTIAHEIDPERDPRDVWRDVKREHPAMGEVVATVRAQLDRLERFVRERDIVTIPPSDPVVVGPTPAFLRWSSASMWTPGPLEKKPLSAAYYVTDADPSWPADKREKHLLDFNVYQLWFTSIHEAYPGHFVQGVWLKHVPSKVRRDGALGPGTYVEGWAHYAEQMMLEQGFGADDPKMRLGQLAEALLRLCRFHVAIGLHTKGMSVDEATRFFMDNGFVEEPVARAEARRGTFDPGYLVYTVGKLEILKLREDVRRARGARFSLREFHDELLRNGQAPLSLHREMMLPGDNGSILEGL